MIFIKPLFFLVAITLIVSQSALANIDEPQLITKAVENKVNPIIPAFKATYTLLHNSDPIGTAIRQLTYVENIEGSSAASQSAVYHYETDIEWLIFSDQRTETSNLSLENGKVTPHHYQYKRKGTGRDKSYEWRYNLPNKTAKDVKNDKLINLAVAEGLQDKLSYHLQNRLDLLNNPKNKQFSYSVITTSGAIKDYSYHYDGEEELILPYGLVKTIRLKREIPEKKRVTYAWFAPELNYLLVKLYQVKAGAEQLEAQLSSIK